MIIPLSEIEDAANHITAFAPPTPLIKSEYYSYKLNTNIYFKLENLNPTHSFKVRGASNAILSLTDEQRKNGVITASGGNHGLAVAYVAARLGIPAHIYLPKNTPESKIKDFEISGANTKLVGNVFDEANHQALETAKNENITYIHPFDNLKVMAGQATIGIELMKQLDKIDAVVMSIGGGGLIAGITSALVNNNSKAQIYGVETIGADSMAQSYQNGKITTIDAITSIANTLGARTPGSRHFEIVKAHVADVVTVTDKEAVETLWDLLENEKMLVEPATSCSLSAVINDKISYQPNDNVVIIICGGNVSVEAATRWREQFEIN